MHFPPACKCSHDFHLKKSKWRWDGVSAKEKIPRKLAAKVKREKWTTSISCFHHMLPKHFSEIWAWKFKLDNECLALPNFLKICWTHYSKFTFLSKNSACKILEFWRENSNNLITSNFGVKIQIISKLKFDQNWIFGKTMRFLNSV